MTWRIIVGIAVAGALGTLARYGLSKWVNEHTSGQFAWGTLAVNALGCFLFGVFWSVAESRVQFSRHISLLALTGFMGAFTTFSTFAFDTTQYLQAKQWGLAALNISVQNVVGILLVLAGLALGHWLFPSMPR